MTFLTITEERKLTQQLIDSVLDKDYTKIQELLSLEKGPNINAEFNGIPLILYAAQNKDWKSFTILYDNMANLDVKIDYSNWALIHECTLNAPDNVFKALIQECDLNLKERNGKTPLMLAIENNKEDRANQLIEKGLNVSAVDKNNDNAGHYAAKKKFYDVLLKLGEFKLPFNQLNKEGKSVLDCIEDISFRENLPKMLKNFRKIDNEKNPILEEEKNEIKNSSKEDLSVTENKETKTKKLGLSSIKRA